MKLFLLALVATAYALPSPDMTVPETELVSNLFDPIKEAQDTVTNLLQSGKDAGACADLAASAVQEVEDAVSAQQKVLDSLDTGADCHTKGQSAVDAAQETLNQANKDKEDADTAAASATSADVAFAPKPLSSLTPNQCDQFFSDPAYLAAVAAKEAATGSATKAAGAVTAAQSGLKAAQDAQAEAIKECQCAAKNAYDKAWEAANANNDADAKAYTKGKHMKCVLEGTPANECNVGEIPKVQAITLADDVQNAECDAPQKEGVDLKMTNELANHCLATTDSNKFACISSQMTGGNRYSGTATVVEQACTEKGLQFTYGKNDNHLLTIDIVKALFKAATGQTCTSHVGQKGGCGWGEIMQPMYGQNELTCTTPHDCNSGNWMKGDRHPSPAETNTGNYANKWAISICSQ